MTKINRAIGIDLGTTNSVMAKLEGGEPKIILNSLGEALTPSAVGIDRKGNLMVGKTPKNRGDAILSVKRFMGLPYESTVEDQRRVAYKVGGKSGEPAQIHFNNRTYTPTQISAMILYQLRQDAQSRLGENIGRAVITVPAYFNDAQVAATREAGRLAGFTVLRILREPTAAALAFGLERRMYIDGGNDTASVLIYDLGGGTFDISILMMMQGNYEVIGIEGDRHLGGDDFDYEISKYIHQRARPGRDLESNISLKRTLKMKAEEAKKELSSASIVEFSIPAVDGGAIEDELSRKEFNKLIAPWIDRTIDLTRKAWDESGLEVIDHILLVGGSTLIPLVPERLQKEFGSEKINKNVDPMLCVAFGAAIQTGLINEIECPNPTCKDGAGHPTRNSVDATECHKCKTSLIGFDVVICPVCLVPTEASRTNCQHCKSSLEPILSSETIDEASPKPRAVARQQHWKCTDCGYPKNPDSALKCEKCEKSRDVGGLKCTKCGESNPQGQSACVKCGEPMPRIGDVIAENIGIGLDDGRMAVLVKKNTPYPLSKTHEFVTVKPNQTEIVIPIRQGPSDDASKNEPLGEITLQVPPGSPVHTGVTVELNLDRDGVLFITVQLTRHSDIRTSIHIARGGDQKKLRRRDELLKKAKQIVSGGEEFPESKSIENRVRDLESPNSGVSEEHLDRLERDIEILKEKVDEAKVVEAPLLEAEFILRWAKDFLSSESESFITRKITSVRESLAHGRNTQAQQDAQELKKHLDEHNLLFVYAVLGVEQARARVSASLLNKIGAALREIKAASTNAAIELAKENVVKVFNEVMQALGDQVDTVVRGGVSDQRAGMQ